MNHRDHLPQLAGDLYLSDGGIETTLIFHEGLDLPLFAAFPLLRSEEGTEKLRSYFERYAALAREHGTGFILESPTWRASSKWAGELGIEVDELDELNRKAIALMTEIRSGYENGGHPFVISGCIGPQDDGYQPSELLSAEAAQSYHSAQVATFRETDADMVTAITMTYVEEALGIARAAREAEIPVAIAFTTETDGRLPSGQALAEAIEQVDAETDRTPAYFMVNCAHPTHFDDALAGGGEWLARIRGVRANASTMSHAELDEATELDAGDPADLAARYGRLREALPSLNVVGGCCGTDHRHIDAIAHAWSGSG